MEPVAEQIPDDLREFLGFVSGLIRSGAEETLVPSDDLIQRDRDCAYGGLSPEDNLFYFRYFHGSGWKWDLCFARDDVEAIANGEIDVLQMWRCGAGHCHNRFACEDFYCDYCSFWSDCNLVRPDPSAEEACMTQVDWLQLFARDNPSATGMNAYNAYQSIPGLENRLGRLPLELMGKKRPIG